MNKNVVQLFSWKDALQCGLGIAGGVAGGMIGAAASCF